MKEGFTFSIVVPHRNIPKLLKRCLDSIPQRDDTEIIVVDDNSNPDVVDFNQFPGKGRKNTTIIYDKSGRGAGHARNIGLNIATGKKILFADADDFFNYCFNEVLDDYALDESDIVFFPVLSIDSNYYTNSYRGRIVNQYVKLYDKDPKTALFHLRFSFGEPWCKLVNKSIIDLNNICFDETSIHNDTRFSYTIGYFSNRILVDKRAIYCVTTREGSVSKLLDDVRKLDRIRVFVERDRFFLDRHINPHVLHCGFHYEEMLRNIGVKEIFDKGLEIFENNGFKRKDVIKRIAQLKKEIKRKNRHAHIVSTVNFLMRRIVRK